MNAIDQHSATISLEEALVPDPSLIDGRTEKDRLGFLADFASLINFYDHNNHVYGNWTPFLLKDPVFLLAAISKTNYSKLYTLYLNTCLKFENMYGLKPDAIEMPVPFEQFNHLFDQLTHIFMLIKRWVYYMQRSNDDNPLKKYVIYQVRTNFSKYLWAIISFRQNLFLSSINRTEAVNNAAFNFSEHYDQIIWKENKDKSPFWDVLDLKYPVKENTPLDLFNALKKVGNEVFHFFHTIISHSTTEFEKLKEKKSKYPDTTLLRAFVNLLKVHQDQLNGISYKHLQFYYKEILKQTEQPSIPDTVIISAELAKKDAGFNLPAGTLFNAGLDLQKKPIVFAALENVALNPAAITAAYTLAVLPGTDNRSSLYLQNITSPGILQKDENGKIQSWETFGGATGSTPVKLGIAFASPLLCVREGGRKISLNLNFANAIDLQLLQTAQFYLSTQNAWVEVTKFVSFPIEKNAPKNSLGLEVNLDSTYPAIESFAKNPDGLECTWPMFKIEFNSFSERAVSPVLNSISIKVEVTDVKTFQLYNDYGGLSTKTPFQPFGPTPLVNSSFIIGNSEIFSKPLDSVLIELDWENLPSDFSIYYQQYNNYLNAYRSAPIRPVTNKPLFNRFITRIKGMVNWLDYVIEQELESNKFRLGLMPFISGNMFTNISFTADFNLLRSHSWNPIDMVKQRSSIVDAERPIFLPYKNDPGCCMNEPLCCKRQPACRKDDKEYCKNNPGYCTNVPGCCKNDPGCCKDNSKSCFPVPSNTLLFSTDGTNCTLTGNSFFSYTAPKRILPFPIPIDKDPSTIVDPDIQNLPLKFTDTSESGFLKITLSGPEYGFGSELYPDVVSYIALQNAWLISATHTLPNTTKTSTTQDPPPFNQPAKLPFAPKLKSITANYTASENYDLNSKKFNSKKARYPIECFLYSPFGNYKVYDNSANPVTYSYAVNKPVTDQIKGTIGAALFQSLKYKGVLFLEMQNLIPSNTINLYFELTGSSDGSSAGKKIEYCYLSTSGWKSLPLLSDGTNNFSCSGIIKVNIPGDITNECYVMPGNKYWLAIAVKGDPSSFPQTVFLKTNGFAAQRFSNSFLPGIAAPQLASNSIAKPQTAIPQIAAIVQPFPSFGGKAAEDHTKMHRRVSARLKTKDRALIADDYSRLIRDEFGDIYYSKTFFDSFKKTTEIYVVKAYDNWTEPNAFLPLVGACTKEKIQTFLSARSSVFSNMRVSNFNLQYVQVTASVSVKPGFETDAIKKNIVHALNIFLSPWITSSLPQIRIDSGISDVVVAGFIKNIKGVSEVQNISFKTSLMLGKQNGHSIDDAPVEQAIVPLIESALFVSQMNHVIVANMQK